jgi:hypothetical protein
MPESNEQPLNGQQMSALQKQFAAELVNLRKDVDLRKWSVDQACGLAGAAIEHKGTVIDPVKTARQIHEFLTEGAKA